MPTGSTYCLRPANRCQTRVVAVYAGAYPLRAGERVFVVLQQAEEVVGNLVVGDFVDSRLIFPVRLLRLVQGLIRYPGNLPHNLAAAHCVIASHCPNDNIGSKEKSGVNLRPIEQR